MTCWSLYSFSSPQHFYILTNWGYFSSPLLSPGLYLLYLQSRGGDTLWLGCNLDTAACSWPVNGIKCSTALWDFMRTLDNMITGSRRLWKGIESAPLKSSAVHEDPQRKHIQPPTFHLLHLETSGRGKYIVGEGRVVALYYFGDSRRSW